jgi:hypothetical protein
VEGNDGKVKIRDSRDGSHEIGIVYALSVIALGLARGIPESIDGTALEPDQEDLGNVHDDVQDCDDDEAATNFWV